MEQLQVSFTEIQDRVPAFVRRRFGLFGTLRLHVCILGLDLLFAPINLFMSAPALFARLSGMLLRLLRMPALAARLDGISFFLPTRMAKSLRAEICDHLIKASSIEQELQALDPKRALEFRQRLDRLVHEYLTARTAMAEFAAAISVLVLGFMIYGGLTPGAFTLAPFIADEYVQSQAISGFWAGSWAGSYWYDFFPERADWGLTLKTAFIIMVAMAFLSTVIGIVTDPLQRWLGLHQHRLRRLVATLEYQTLGDQAKGLRLPDTFLPRLVDAAETVIIMTRIGP